MKTEIRKIADKYLVPYDEGYRFRQGRALSISESEGEFMVALIKKHKLKRGYEIATGTGYSSLWLRFALPELYSIDNYSECGFDRSNPAPLFNTLRMHSELSTKHKIYFEVADSPKDVANYVEDVGKFDCVFIDGAHGGGHPQKDYNAIVPFLSKRCAIFWHDISSVDVKDAVRISIRDDFVEMPGYGRLAVTGRGIV